jgi:hypothetical protein
MTPDNSGRDQAMDFVPLGVEQLRQAGSILSRNARNQRFWHFRGTVRGGAAIQLEESSIVAFRFPRAPGA